MIKTLDRKKAETTEDSYWNCSREFLKAEEFGFPLKEFLERMQIVSHPAYSNGMYGKCQGLPYKEKVLRASRERGGIKHLVKDQKSGTLPISQQGEDDGIVHMVIYCA